jgi:hypothetical protein
MYHSAIIEIYYKGVKVHCNTASISLPKHGQKLHTDAFVLGMTGMSDECRQTECDIKIEYRCDGDVSALSHRCRFILLL